MTRITNPNADKSALLAILRQELLSDPAVLGYAQATDSQAATLVSDPQGEQYARWFQITIGVPFAPNVVDSEDVSDARK